MRINFLFSFLFLATITGFAQLKINSPYSRLGVGDISQAGYSYNRGMAGVGVSNASLFFINNVNPAMLQRNKYVVYEVGMESQTRSLSSDNETQTNGDLTLDYLALSIPINRWNVGAGLKKYSQVNYNISSVNQINSTDYSQVDYSGKGGLNEAGLTAAYRVSQDTSSNLTVSLGLSANYIFGQIERNQTTELFVNGSTQGERFTNEVRNSYNGFQFKTGVGFRKELLYVNKSQKTTNDLGQDTTTRSKAYFFKDVVNDVALTALVGENIVVYPNRKGVYLDQDIHKDEDIDRLLALYRGLAGDFYGVYILESATDKTNKELKAEFIALTVDGQESKPVNAEILSHTNKFIRKHSGLYVNFGLSYDLKANLNGTSDQYLNRDNISGLSISKDTLATGLNTSIVLPSTFRAGISLDKMPTQSELSGLWTLGLDVSYTKWSQFSDQLTEVPYQDNYKVALGGEITPHVASTSYLKRMTYRAGVFYGSAPYKINGTSFSDVGITFGLTMPVGIFTVSNPPKNINLGVTLGQRGTTDNNLIKEKYALVSLSFNFNSRWFQRYKLGL